MTVEILDILDTAQTFVDDGGLAASRGFVRRSASSGRTGRFVRSSQSPAADHSLNGFFTLRGA